MVHSNGLSANTGGQSKVNARSSGSEELCLSSSAKSSLEGWKDYGWDHRGCSGSHKGYLRGKGSFLGALEGCVGSHMHVDRNYSS